MYVTNKVVPGKTENLGIRSEETFYEEDTSPRAPWHLPDFASVTPKGKLGRVLLPLENYESILGDIQDPYGMFYNPINLAIRLLKKNQQHSVNFTRLTNNTEHARSVPGVAVFKDVSVPLYERDPLTNAYIYDELGKPKKKGDFEKGVVIIPGYVEITSTSQATGALRSIEVTAPEGGSVPASTKGTFYPFIDFESGIGDAYNSSYVSIGHDPRTVDYNSITEFVLKEGVYPYQMKMGETAPGGRRLDSTNLNGGYTSAFTLFDMVTSSGIKYSLKEGLNSFTGMGGNRPKEPRNVPYQDAKIYKQNIERVCQIIYEAEYGENSEQTPPNVLTDKYPAYAIMNPLELLDHRGNPYRNVVFGEPVEGLTGFKPVRFSLNHYVPATGGINPYADKDGKYPPKPALWVEETRGTWITDVKSPFKPSMNQCWEMTQILLSEHFDRYFETLDFKNVIRNRTSFIWDVGYSTEIKNKLNAAIRVRKDLIVVPCATIWLDKQEVNEIYSLATMLHTRFSMLPESEVYQTDACRAGINLWPAKVLDEATEEYFSLNLDLMCAFAKAGGNRDGRVYPSSLPDSEKGCVIGEMHSPLISFEDDDPAANNLDKGFITVACLNFKDVKRPALPTVFTNRNSVLKDLPNVWYCVIAEKVVQDVSIQITGVGNLGRETLESRMKDRAEARLRADLGAIIPRIEVTPYWVETDPNGNVTMHVDTHLWLGKQIYMVKSTVVVHNRDEIQ